MQLKKEVLRVQTENLFLESYLEPESAVDDVTGIWLDLKFQFHVLIT